MQHLSCFRKESEQTKNGIRKERQNRSFIAYSKLLLLARFTFEIRIDCKSDCVFCKD